MRNNEILPTYLQTIDAFKCGEQLAIRLRPAGGGKAKCTQSMLDILNDRNSGELEIVLACETIAESIGHPCWDRTWNIYLCEWLYKTKFVADDVLINTAIGRIESLLRKRNVSSEWLVDIEKLLIRLRNNPNLGKRVKPVLSKAAYRKLAIGFDHLNEAFGVVQSILAIYNPTFTRALEATSLKPESVTEISVGFSGEPSMEDREAVAILLHRFRDTIQDLSCNAQMGRGSEQTDLTRDFWHELLPQVKQLSKLKWFQSTFLPINEADALVVLSLPSLKGFRYSARGTKFRIDIDYTDLFVRAACENENILLVAVPSLSEELVEDLRTASSHPALQINGRLVVDANRITPGS